MDGQTDYYALLGLERKVTAGEIKNAYRRLALAHHPDVNADSAEAHARFVLIANAYSTLGDPARRTAYDRFIAGSTTEKAASPAQAHGPARPDSAQAAAAERNAAPEKSVIVRAKPLSGHNRDYFENQLNYILWDIGDLMMKDHDWRGNKSYDAYAFRKEALVVLTFIDKWVLESAGLADHFMDARRLGRIDPRTYINTIGTKGTPGTHTPFTSAENYYYDIRKRMNKYLEKIDTMDLLAPLASSAPIGTGAPEIRIIDALIETQKLSFHYIAYLKAIIDGTHAGAVPAFAHAHSIFTWPERIRQESP